MNMTEKTKTSKQEHLVTRSLLDSSYTVNEYLTRKEVAKLLRISLVTLHSYTKKGMIPAYRIGCRVLYKFNEVSCSINRINYDIR